jgi:hypothetical protein
MSNKSVWRKRWKEALAQAFGSKCCLCGYRKCIEAFDFHHLDENEKEASISKMMVNGAAWDKIKEEAKKCILVCCRCHRELYSGFIEIPEDVTRFDE